MKRHQLCAAILLSFLFVAIFAPLLCGKLYPHDPFQFDINAILAPPSATHWLGTDQDGRDVLAELVWGARTSLTVGICTTLLSLSLGIFFGTLAGWFGGVVDLLISRFIEVLQCFPVFFLVLTLLALLGPSLWNIVLVLGLTQWTGIARLVRTRVLQLRASPLILSARTLGASFLRILLRHLLPLMWPAIQVSAYFAVAYAIGVEAGLSFLGFGVSPETPSWGNMLAAARNVSGLAWWLTLAPGSAILLLVLALQGLGEHD